MKQLKFQEQLQITDSEISKQISNEVSYSIFFFIITKINGYIWNDIKFQVIIYKNNI